MVRRKQDMQAEQRENMRGGRGSVDIRHLEKELLPESGRLFAVVTVPPGGSIGPHEHVGETELFYFVKGEGVVADDAQRVAVRAGDAMTTPSGHSHSVENTGQEDLVLVAAILKG